MDPRLYDFYTRELAHLREVAAEFATEYPKQAARLGLETFECQDPYVERMLEGAAFLNARAQLKLSSEFPRFTHHLLESIYPSYLAPLPSMTVVQFHPDLTEGSLAEGFPLPRETSLRSVLGKGEQTACEFRTAHEVKLWPLELTEAEYYAYPKDLAPHDLPEVAGVKAGIRLRLRATAGLNFSKIALDALPVFIRGADETPMFIHEQLLANTVGVVVRPAVKRPKWQELLGGDNVRRIGFSNDEALLPTCARSFHGYRLLQEYFAFPQKFLFAELAGLSVARRCTEKELDIYVLLGKSNLALENIVEPDNFALFCAPAVNLFRKRTDRIHLSEKSAEYHIVVDRTRPLDFEVHSVGRVVGHGASGESREFLPFYTTRDWRAEDGRRTWERSRDRAYYAVHREPRRLSTQSQRKRGRRSASYIGTEVYVSLVDANEAPIDPRLRQLALEVLCTNRDLPVHMPMHQGSVVFTMESGAPVETVKCVAGPTLPRPPRTLLGIPSEHKKANLGDTAWRLISHLSLNYLSIIDTDAEGGAAALRELLSLYADTNDDAVHRQILGIKSITAKQVVRRLPTPGPIAFGRGLELKLSCEDLAFEGTGSFILGAVLEEFFAKYVSINSFTETVLETVDRGEVMRWPMRTGLRHNL